MICLKCSDNGFWGGDVSSDVSCVPEGKVDLVRVVFSRWLLGIPGVIKKAIRGHKRATFWYKQL